MQGSGKEGTEKMDNFVINTKNQDGLLYSDIT